MTPVTSRGRRESLDLRQVALNTDITKHITTFDQNKRTDIMSSVVASTNGQANQ